MSCQITDLAQRARTRQLKQEELQGSCCTITNLGGLGVGSFCPIVNAPEAAILALSKAELRPVYDDKGKLQPRLEMPVGMSYDHRLVDGADGARFMRCFIDGLTQISASDIRIQRSKKR